MTNLHRITRGLPRATRPLPARMPALERRFVATGDLRQPLTAVWAAIVDAADNPVEGDLRLPVPCASSCRGGRFRRRVFARPILHPNSR